MNKILLIKFSFFLLITVSCSKETIEKPNIVLIVADDLGWSDLSYMGSTYYETPNIDKLSKSGMTFTMDTPPLLIAHQAEQQCSLVNIIQNMVFIL